MHINRLNHDLAIEPSELIVTPAGAIYHLGLKPDDIANDIIVVGDQNRVARISKYFDHIECKIESREFVTHTGTYKGKRITALSTGIGADNLDIVINELDALVNIDLETKKLKKELRSLNIIRLGTSGALQEDIAVDSFVVSSHGLGFDGVMGFYDAKFDEDETSMEEELIKHTNWNKRYNHPYFVKGNSELIERIGEGMTKGITITANGFYGPQGRVLALSPREPDLNERLRTYIHSGNRITNYEMETAALFGLSAMLGHNACTVCAIIANRYSKKYSKDYKKSVDELIQIVLERI